MATTLLPVTPSYSRAPDPPAPGLAPVLAAFAHRYGLSEVDVAAFLCCGLTQLSALAQSSLPAASTAGVPDHLQALAAQTGADAWRLLELVWEFPYASA